LGVATLAGRKSYPGLLLNQNKHRFFFATIPVDDLFPSCFVARRDEEPETGFQRALNEARADDIARYLANGSGSIPSNIVLSAQPSAVFKYNSTTKSISFQVSKKAFLVLDGQHRLWGYQKCKLRHRVPVAVYSGLTHSEEAKLFVDINTTQRGVPAALLLDIKQIAEIETNIEKVLRATFDRLNKDAESPLVGKLSPSKSVTGKISRVTFNRSVGPVLTGGVMSETAEEQRYRLIRNYLNAFDAEITDKTMLTRSAFFEAIFEIFDQVVQNAIATTKSAKQPALQKIIQRVARLDYRRSGGQGLLEKKEIVRLMKATLRTKTPISNEML
jgi:DGQHR domain-containing protein